MNIRMTLDLTLSLILACGILPIESKAQYVNEWAINKSALTEPFRLAAADGLHLACIGRIQFDNAITLSSDGGQSWQTVYTEPGADNSQSAFAEIKNYAVAYPHPDLVLVARSRFDSETKLHSFSLLRTDDAGASWSAVQFGHSPFSAPRIALDFCDKDHGLLASQSLFKTDDGGKTWDKLAAPSVDLSGLRSLFCFDRNSYIIATASAIYNSTDGGVSWQIRKALPTNILNIDFHDARRGWAVASVSTGVGDRQRDLIYATTDGGASWSTPLDDEIEPAFGLVNIDFADADNGIAVGRFNKILRTTDGGITWVKERTPFEFSSPVIFNTVYPVPDNAIALGINTMLRYTGKTVLAPPVLTLTADPAKLTGTLRWSGVNSAQSYRLQIAAKIPGSFDGAIQAFKSHTSFDTSGVVEREFVLDGRLKYGMRYFFRVQALLDDETSDWSAAATVLTDEDPDFVEFDQPILIAPEESAVISGQTIDFQWEDVEGAEWYDFQLADDPLFTGNLIVSDDNVTSTDFSIQTSILNPSSIYFWRVRARSEKGIGIWRGRIFQTGVLSSVAGDAARSSASLALQTYPNPAKALTKLEFSLEAASSVTIRIVNLRGEVLRTILDGDFHPSGTHSANVNCENLSIGSYVLAVNVEGLVEYLPFVIVE